MKIKKEYLILTALFLITIIGCDINNKEELIINPVDSIKSTSTSLIVDSDNVIYDLVVEASEPYPADRFVKVLVSENSTASGVDYNFTGTVVIKAGERTGSTPIKFNFDVIPLDTPRALILKIEGSTNETTINYNKVCVSNDINIHIVFDDYPEETSWELTDSNSTVVASGSNYSGQTELNLDLTLPGGSYTFTIIDAYSDGICCAYGNGSYTLTVPMCSTTLAQGASFGASESTQFILP